MVAVDTSERAHVIDVRSSEELEVTRSVGHRPFSNPCPEFPWKLSPRYPYGMATLPDMILQIKTNLVKQLSIFLKIQPV